MTNTGTEGTNPFDRRQACGGTKSQGPFLEEFGEVMSEVWHGSPVEYDENGDEILTPPGLAVVWAEVRAEVRDAWRAYRGGVR